MRRTGKKPAHLLIAAIATAALALVSLEVATPSAAHATAAAAAAGTGYVQPGVTYVGYPLDGGRVLYDAPQGAGRVEVTVSADGRSISRFAVTNAVFPANPANAACAGTTYSYTLEGPLPITTPPGYDDDFLFFSNMSNVLGQVNPLEVDGNIDPGRMIGRFQYEEPGWDEDPFNHCTTQGDTGWAASAPGGCLGSPEHVQLQDRFDALTKAMKKLSKKIKQAKKAGKDNKARKLQHKYHDAKSDRHDVKSALGYLCNQP